MTGPGHAGTWPSQLIRGSSSAALSAQEPGTCRIELVERRSVQVGRPRPGLQLTTQAVDRLCGTRNGLPPQGCAEQDGVVSKRYTIARGMRSGRRALGGELSARKQSCWSAMASWRGHAGGGAAREKCVLRTGGPHRKHVDIAADGGLLIAAAAALSLWWNRTRRVPAPAGIADR